MLKDQGLITAFLLDGNGGGKELQWEDIAAWTPEQGILWIHLDYTSKQAMKWLNQNSGLDKVTVRAMTIEEPRPRSIITQNGLLVFLRGINLNPEQDLEDMVSIRIWLDEHRIITTRKRRLLFIQDIKTAIGAGTGPKTPGDFLRILNDCLLDHISQALNDIDEQADQLEQEVITAKSYLLRPKIADLRRNAIVIRRYLAPQREALNRLYLEETPLFTAQDRIQLREATDRIVKYIEDLDSARDRTAITQEELSSRLSEQMDKRIYILSVVAVIFLPLTFITGLLGINVAGIPGATYKWAFLIVCSMLFVFLLLITWILRKKEWI